MCRKIDYKKIGQNLEIFPAGDTGLRLRKFFKIFKKKMFCYFVVKCIEKLIKHIFGKNLEIFPAGDTGLRLRKFLKIFKKNCFCYFVVKCTEKLMNNFLGH